MNQTRSGPTLTIGSKDKETMRLSGIKDIESATQYLSEKDIITVDEEVITNFCAIQLGIAVRQITNTTVATTMKALSYAIKQIGIDTYI